MSITTSCPGCESLFRLPDDLAGQQVRCQKCERLFDVPMPIAGTPEPSAAAPESPPPEVPIEATLDQEAPTEEVVLATLSEPKKEQPKPPPLPKAPVQAERPAGILGALALLLLFLLGLIGTGAFAAIWIAMHLAAPLGVTSVPPLNAARDAKNDNRDLQKWGDKEQKGMDDLMKMKRQPLTPTVVDLGNDVNGRRFINEGMDQLPWVDHGKWGLEGPYHLYRIHLKEGATYNFHVSPLNFQPRLRIFDGDAVVADRQGGLPANRLMVAYQPKRTGDHLLWITGAFFAKYDLTIIPQLKQNPIKVDLTLQPNYTDLSSLLDQDPLDPGANQFGPYRDYEVKLDPDKEYTISIANATFPPVLRLGDNKLLTTQNLGPVQISHSLRPGLNGIQRLRVTSEQCGLGRYTLTIVLKQVAVQTILAALDGNGSFEDKRQFTSTDPKLVGRGSYKEYVVGLEQGKKYRVEVTLGDSPTSVAVFDGKNLEAGAAANKKEASVTFVAKETGNYRIRAIAPLAKNREEYTLRISTEP